MTTSANRKILAISLALAFALPGIARSEETGTSCADCPSYTGAFSIENQTGVAIPYMIRWGSNRPWKHVTLASGRVETHSYPLGANKHASVPTPYVRFDRIGGDGSFTPQEYRMEFNATGYAGYGPSQNKTQPKEYYFRYAADGKNLDLKAR